MREQRSYPDYLSTLLGAEVEERERHTVERRIHEARLPRLKTLEEFDFAAAPHLPVALIRTLAGGDYLAQAQPVIFIGDSGTGKTHLATALALEACRQKSRKVLLKQRKADTTALAVYTTTYDAVGM